MYNFSIFQLHMYALAMCVNGRYAPESVAEISCNKVYNKLTLFLVVTEHPAFTNISTIFSCLIPAAM